MKFTYQPGLYPAVYDEDRDIAIRQSVIAGDMYPFFQFEFESPGMKFHFVLVELRQWRTYSLKDKINIGPICVGACIAESSIRFATNRKGRKADFPYEELKEIIIPPSVSTDSCRDEIASLRSQWQRLVVIARSAATKQSRSREGEFDRSSVLYQ